jgi:hypothetical protein
VKVEIEKLRSEKKKKERKKNIIHEAIKVLPRTGSRARLRHRIHCKSTTKNTKTQALRVLLR